MQVRGRLPDAEQGGRVDAGERPAGVHAGERRDGADVVQHAARAVGEFGPSVAEIAAELFEQDFARDAVSGQRSIGVAEGAGVDVIQRGDVGGQRIQLGAQAGLGIAERLIARPDVKDVVRQETGSVEQVAYLMLEVLHLVERAGPVQAAVPGPLAAEQRGRVAQPFAARGEIVDAAVVVAFEVAAAAAHVALERHPRVLGVVEDLLSREDLGGQLLAGDGRDRGELRRRGSIELIEQRRHDGTEIAGRLVFEIEL